MNAIKRSNFLDLLLGCLGVLFSITGYFLIDRDAEIRDGLEKMGSEISAIRIDVQRLTSEEHESQFRVRNLESTTGEISQRVARVEALLEPKRN